MIKLQNQFKIISFCLFVLLGLLLITNNHKIMGMGNNNSSNELNDLNEKLNKLLEEQEQIIAKIVNIEHHEEIMSEFFDNKVRSNYKAINEVKERIHILTERQIIDEKMNDFIDKRNDVIIQILNSNDSVRVQTFLELIHLNRQVDCLNRREQRLNNFLKIYQKDNQNNASTSY
ncbi:MAG: putative secreted protein [Rapeseed phyllody phytoplasma]|uniref:Putative secreted protein n=1 Tax=Rapeseed phyllody phytoplasma TaxID=2490543 RepID=A0A859I9B2_9MOLU|nr:MAG: putative secreted protein [Rapeseed phyllody phytoplasma]QKX95204.1 MAG: putative secreted protein [Rapeseed phyllody phytoplasma]